MAQHNYVDYLFDLLAPLGPLRAKPMFGAHGIYFGDAMFGVVSDDIFYLKTDDTTRAVLAAQGSEPLRYESRGRTVALSYWRVPDAMLDDEDALLTAARDAIAIAKASADSKRRKS